MLKKEYASSVDGYEESVKLKADRKESFLQEISAKCSLILLTQTDVLEQLNETESTIHTLLHGDNTGGTAG